MDDILHKYTAGELLKWLDGRYEVIKRGHNLYVHDNKTCQDILSWNFNNDNYEYIQNTANNTCESLNNNTMRFIGKKDNCW